MKKTCTPPERASFESDPLDDCADSEVTPCVSVRVGPYGSDPVYVFVRVAM